MISPIWSRGKYFHSYIFQSSVTLLILIIREITSNYLAEQPEPQPNFGRLFPIEEGKFEEGITEKTQNAVPKLDMKEENPLSSQEFKPKIQELSECYSNSHPEGVFSNDQEVNILLYIYIYIHIHIYIYIIMHNLESNNCNASKKFRISKRRGQSSNSKSTTRSTN